MLEHSTLAFDYASKTKKQILVLIGYLEAEDKIYEEKRSKFVVLEGNFSNPLKGDEELLKKIRKRKDGRWEGRININGKRQSIYGSTQRSCYEKMTKIKRDIKPVPNVPTKTISTRFDLFAVNWLENFKKIEVGKGTYSVYENLVKNYLSKIKVKINELTTSQLQAFLNELGQNRTKELVYQTIKQIFRKALELDLIKKDVSQFLVKGRIERKERRSFTLEEQKIILENLKPNTISKYILAYLLLGARLSELKSIKKENIKQNYVLIKGTKTKNAERWVRISDRYQEILLSYPEPIFNCQPDTIKAKMKEFFKKIKIDGSTHMLRHTFATNLYYLGVDDNTRKQYLGHSSIVVTNDIYTHLDPTIHKQDILNLYKDLYPEF